MLADNKFSPSQGLGNQNIDCTPINLLKDQARTDKHRHHQTNQVHGRQPNILQNLLISRNRNLGQIQASPHHQQQKQEQEIENFVANRFSKGVVCNRPNPDYVHSGYLAQHSLVCPCFRGKLSPPAGFALSR